ncbi:MAG: EFR1 family ferrodoxin [Sphaerochaetaceae bacterium]
MRTTLFCYSATGNSFYVATELAKKLGDTTIVTLPTDKEITISEQVGIIAPVYALFPPQAITDFITKQLGKADLSEMKYLFCIHTYCTLAGYAPLLTELCLQDIGCLSSYQNKIQMPGTYIPLYDVASQVKIDKLYAKADEKLKKIASDIQNEKLRLSFKLPFAKLCKYHLMPITQRTFSSTDENFTVNDNCNGCGQCERFCPAHNITIVEGKPQFNHACYSCFGCYHRCSKHAIEYKKKKRGYYPNLRSHYEESYRK